MRAIPCAFALIVVLAAPSYAQTPGAAYMEFGGSIMYYSINGEVPVARNRTVRVGGMVLPGLATGATASFNQLIGRGTDFLVLLTPLITNRGVHPYAGLSIGRSF